MSTVWNHLDSLIEAADPVRALQQLLSFVERRYGEHEKDEVRALVSRPGKVDPKALAKEIGSKYMNPELDKLVGNLMNAMNPAPAVGKKKADEPDFNVDPANSKDKGSGGAEPIPARPDRAGTQMAQPPKRPDVAHPRSKEFQAMGSAGQGAPQDQPSQNVIPKTKDTKELERLHGLLNNPDWIRAKVHSYVKANPNFEPGEVKVALIKQIKDKIQKLGRAGDSTIRTKLNMEPDRFFRQGGSKTDIEDMPASAVDAKASGQAPPEAPVSPGTVKPDHAGTFIGQRWAPNAYTKDSGDQVGVGGGLKDKSIGYGNAATGNTVGGKVDANPANPGQKWRDEHDLIWAGDKNGGWVTKSQFAALVGQGKIRRAKPAPGPSNPDLSDPKYRTLSPVNPPNKDRNRR